MRLPLQQGKSPMHDLLASLLIVIGAFLCLSAAVGLVRFPDIYSRMHAASKAGTLGIGCLFLAAIFHFADIEIAILCILAIAFFMLTAPVSAHLLARAAYRSGVKSWARDGVDQLAGRYDETDGRLAGHAFENDLSTKN